MATILPFVIPPRATQAARTGEACAEIVIFPGVRYETPRSDDVDDPPSNGAQRKRKSAKTR